MSNFFKVSNSKVKTYRRCRYAYHLKYVEKLRKKVKSRPLTFGELAHSIIEAHAQGDDPFSVLDNIQPERMRIFEAEREMYGDLINDLRCILGEYFEHWGEDSVEYIRLHKRSAEHEFELDVEDGLRITGKIDAFARTPNGLNWLMEHKTFTTMPNEDQHWRNVQSTLYIRISEMLGWVNVDGTLWDYIRSKPPAWPQLLKNGTMSKRGIDTLPQRLRAFAKAEGVRIDKSTLESATRNRSRYFQRIFTPTKPGLIDKVYSDFLETAREMRAAHGRSKAKTIDRHCDWCEYEPICRAELRLGDVDYIKEKDYEVRENDALPARGDIVARPPGVRHTPQPKHGRLRAQRNRQNNIRLLRPKATAVSRYSR